MKASLKIKEYIYYNPFSKFQFYKIKAPSSTLKNEAIAIRLKEMFQNMGAMSAKRKINKDGKNSNFGRDYAKFLTTNDDIPDIYEVHKSDLEHFFKEGGINE